MDTFDYEYIKNLTNNGYKCIYHNGVSEGEMRKKNALQSTERKGNFVGDHV